MTREDLERVTELLESEDHHLLEHAAAIVAYARTVSTSTGDYINAIDAGILTLEARTPKLRVVR